MTFVLHIFWKLSKDPSELEAISRLRGWVETGSCDVSFELNLLEGLLLLLINFVRFRCNNDKKISCR